MLFHLHQRRGQPGEAALRNPESAPNRVLLAAGMAMFLVNLDFFALNLSLPRMATDLGVTSTNLQWVISGYMLALAAFLIPGGRLADILGRRRMLITGVLIFAGASVVCGLSDSAGLIIGVRILQGMGAGIIYPTGVAVVSNAFPPETQGRAIGYLYGVAAMATAVGPFFGGFITQTLTWRWVFFINIPLAALAIGLTLAFVRESRDETVPRQIDVAGLLAVALGIAAITFAVDASEDAGWISVQTLGVLGAGVALLAAFVAIERRVRFPLVELSLFRNRPYVVVTLLGALANTAFVITTFSATLYLQQVRGYSPLAGGAIFLAASVTLAIAGPLSGILGERYDVPRLMAAGIGAGAAGLLVVAAGPSLGVYILGLAVFGAGYGLGWSLASIGTQAVVPTNQAGAASGVTLAMVIGLAGLGVAVVATLIESISGGGTSQGTAIEEILRAVAIGSVVLALALMAVRERLRRRAATLQPSG